MSGNPARGRGGRGGGDRGGQRGGRGDSAPRGGRGDFQGGGGGGQRGRGDSAPRGGRGNFQGDGGRGGRGDSYGAGRGRGMAMRGPPPGRGGIYLAGQQVPPPDPRITAAEDALVKQTRDKIIDDFPGRRGYGTKGKQIVLYANYLQMTTAYEANMPEKPLFRYEVNVANDDNLSKNKRRRLIDQVMILPLFEGVLWATDYGKTVLTDSKLDLEKLMSMGQGEKKQGEKKKDKIDIILPPEDGNGNGNGHHGDESQGPAPEFVRQARDRNTWSLRLNYQGSFQLRELVEYIRSPSAGAAYEGRKNLIQMLNIIVTKPPNQAANVANVGQNKFYPFEGHPGIEAYDLGSGLQALRGYYASVRPSIGRLLLNLNVTAGAFFKPKPLIDLLREFGGNWEQAEAFVRMLKVKATYIKDGQTVAFAVKTKTLVGLAKEIRPPTFRVKRFGNANEVKFQYVDRAMPNPKPKMVSVADYFRQHHGITLKRPELPVFNVGTRPDPQYLPAELCTVLPGQPYRRLLGGDQTSEMLKFAARAPNLNAMSITGTAAAPGNGLRLFRLADPSSDPQAHSTKPFGLSISTSMITVPGRILPTPTVQYGGKKSINPRNGSWNCADVKFVKPGKFTKWTALVINHGGNRGKALFGEPEPLVAKFDKFLRDYGIAMGQREKTRTITLDQLTIDKRPTNDRQLQATFAKAKEMSIDVMLVVIPEADKWLYARIKFYGDVEYGVQTICSVGSKISKENGQGMYFGNLALKFNLKGGGISHTVQNTVQKPIDNNTMLVGIDVTHPSPGSAEGSPSIACMVASMDSQMFQWPGSIRSQTGRQEQVAEIEKMLNERLDLWVKKNGKLPTKIVVYRDGVSEGQYDMVLTKELPGFEKAFLKRYGAKEKWPKMAIIVVGKRHHTRFYPTRQEDADYNPQREKGSWNPLPGTVVDRGIASKVLREFWLQAHQGLQGTARPAHYVVLKDELSFEADEMEQFTHHLCYLFNRATKAVSICPPAYYADLLCERGRAYLFTTLGENHASDSSVSNSEAEWTGDVHEKLKETTWYV